MDDFTGFVILIVAAIAYFFPTVIAIHRDHPNRVAICLLNLFFGWTVIGWFGALIWSVLAIDKKVSA